MELRKVSIAEITSLRIGGYVDMVVVTSEDEVKEAVTYAQTHNKIVHVLGGGTNSYFAEDLSSYLVIKNEIMGIDEKTQENGHTVLITCGAGEIWDDVVVYAVDRGYWGIENLSFIPGTTGGAPVQNIGAYGAELKTTLVSVAAFDCKSMQQVTLSNDACQFGYRDSLFKHKKGRYCITSVTLTLSTTPNPILTYSPLTALQGSSPSLTSIRNEVIRIRTEKLPNYHEFPNAGSFFKNPIIRGDVAQTFSSQFLECPMHHLEGGTIKIPAAWLLEHIAEVKGVRSGPVGTWPKQPLVIVNYGGATAEDINNFADIIVEKVKEKTGITLEREVNYIQ
jgi:UDP-N-acetylmuramate dehydrogenase